MKRRHLLVTCLAVTITFGAESIGQEKEKSSAKVVRIGAVGNRAKTGVFENLTKVLTKRGYPSEVVPFASYDAMNEALHRGKIDIAWNAPYSHAQFHVRNQCESQTLAMREGDVGLHVVLIAKDESGIKSLDDLNDKRTIVGRAKYQEGMLSVHFLKKGGVDLEKAEVIHLAEKDSAGQRTDTPTHILKALADGRSDAAVVPLGHWKRATAWREKHPNVKEVWKSPSFNHCVFTASKDFDTDLGRQFTRLMTTLDPKDRLVSELNQLEGTRKWLPGDSKGFESLVEAIQELEKE
jgi:ABC-type phosphate/phosphonate transport system substrate-binding protein